MTSTEREMVRPLEGDAERRPQDRSTSLQPTYEDSVPPYPEDEWEHEAS